MGNADDDTEGRAGRRPRGARPTSHHSPLNDPTLQQRQEEEQEMRHDRMRKRPRRGGGGPVAGRRGSTTATSSPGDDDRAEADLSRTALSSNSNSSSSLSSAARRTIVFGDDVDDRGCAERVGASKPSLPRATATAEAGGDHERDHGDIKRKKAKHDDLSEESNEGESGCGSAASAPVDLLEATMGAWDASSSASSSLASSSQPQLLLSQEPSTASLSSSLLPASGLTNLPSEASRMGDAKQSASSFAVSGMPSSLFGSVMASATKSSSSSRNDRTPVKANNARSGMMMTMDRGSDAAMSMLLSPGGFKIMEFLNNVHNQSPMVPIMIKKHQYQHASPTTPNAKVRRHEHDHTTPLSTASTPFSQRGVDDDDDNDGWRDVNFPDEAIGDWAVYQSVHVEVGGHDRSAHKRSLLPMSDLDVEHEARTSFVHYGMEVSASSTAAAQWRASLLYWCFPRAACRVQFHSSTGSGTAAASTIVGKAGKAAADSKAQPSTLKLSQSSAASTSQFGTMEASRSAFAVSAPVPKHVSKSGTAARGAPALLMDDAGRRWQDAFRSLYRNWVHQIGRLQDDDCYFYATGIGHTALFRVTTNIECNRCEDDKENGDMASDSPSRSPRTVQPQIVISATTPALRSKLRDMGVTRMHLLARWDGHSTSEDFQESWLTVPLKSKDASASRSKDGTKGTSSSSTASSSAMEMSSPDVRAELAALRRAQAMRQTVGATISVSTAAPKSKTDKPVAAPDRIPPLVITGLDDCAIFMEVYLNTLGLQLMHGLDGNTDKDRGPDVDLPTLLCRRLGPFHHSCMESMSETNRTKDAVTLRGIVLPCAARELVASTVRLVKEATSNEAPTDRHSHASDGAEAPSHALFRFQLHLGRPLVRATTSSTARPPRAPAGHIGMCHTAFFNAVAAASKPRLVPTTSTTSAPTSSASTRVRRLRCGQVLSTVVWDSEADHLVSYRVLDQRRPSYGGTSSSFAP